MQITKNFTLEELTRSDTAAKKGIDNTPDEVVKKRLTTLCKTVLQPIRDKYGKSIIVGSGYRCKALNTTVKGASNSDHMYGCAADIHSASDSVADNKELFNLIKKMIDSKEIKVKQLIDEYNYNWIHISYQDGRSSKVNQILHLK